ncbi:pirin family protein [Persicimonas caeni]|uniref:Pirin family protein n=1 Tax=Persicimonas caeni TaxID=2292766 RepID=A0A4Y6PXE6_PERCE|nr:pirin family protein [Persicimonas caeni]QDG53002.1 pirin family protein [Persicimonas caeni]QED34224.1 pirin family protein [Persicimonas caeni]
MIEVRPADERGHTDMGWLDSRHSFSFGGYRDPRHMGFRKLRVINDDRVAPGAGFGTHPHRDMEIISYVVEGALEHKDSMGNGSVIEAGEVQRMSAGTGVRHSEYNASDTEPVRFLQIWIPPRRAGLEPSYEQRKFRRADRRGALKLLVSPDGRDDSLSIHQDASIWGAVLEEGDTVEYSIDAGRHAWVQVVDGTVTLGDITLSEGDGAAISDEAKVAIEAAEDAELLLFDLA